MTGRAEPEFALGGEDVKPIAQPIAEVVQPVVERREVEALVRRVVERGDDGTLQLGREVGRGLPDRQLLGEADETLQAPHQASCQDQRGGARDEG